MLPRNRRITVGLLGGSFNPAHEGHVYISLEAIKRLGLDEVWWLVSPQNPLKPVEGMLPLEKRLTLAQNIAKHPNIVVTGIEKALNTRYTYHTILKLKKKFPYIRFVWLMGSDNLEQFPKWYRWRDILNLLPIVVFERGNNSYRALKGKTAGYCAKNRLNGCNIKKITTDNPPLWAFIRLRKHPASATQLRKTLVNTTL